MRKCRTQLFLRNLDDEHIGTAVICLPMYIMENHMRVGLQCTQVAQKNPLEQLTDWVDSDALKWVIL